jgi:DNA polymerase elongation subunit (family B)
MQARDGKVIGGEMKKTVPIYTMDIETDPFKYGRMPQPFCIGFYDGHYFHNEWGDDCISRMRSYVEMQEPGIIYMHNGGRFDIFYLIDWLAYSDENIVRDSKMIIVNSRILKAECRANGGKHEIRDSYAILPFALMEYQKDEIDYEKMERERRESHKSEILNYLDGDCRYLYELCKSFIDMFGTKLTIGGTAMNELQKIHTFDCLDEIQDEEIRGRYYYGGRVQCFKRGILNGYYNIYDVNSMYPYVMKNFYHPCGPISWIGKEITENTCFISAEGKNYGALPRREKEGIRFDCEDGIFHATIHEWRTALSHGLFEPERIISCVNFERQSTFEQFVDKFYNLRIEAKDNNDATHALFYKYILNSSYGKFAQNPENYYDYRITRSNVSLSEWELAYFPNDDFIIWKKKTTMYKRYNVATAASITGAARSVLLDAIAKAKDPLYCDTDSIICKSISGIEIDDSKLGSWKNETKLSRICIAGKKLYAAFDGDECVKQACKGVRLSPDEIVRLCKGETIESRRDAPSFKIGQIVSDRLIEGNKIQHTFITRKVRMR